MKKGTSNGRSVQTGRLFHQEWKQYKRKSIVRIFLSLALICVIAFSANFMHERLALKYFHKEALESMTRVSSQASAAVSQNVGTWYDELEIIRQYVSVYSTDAEDQGRDGIYDCLTRMDFKLFHNVGLLTEDGELILSKNRTYRVPDDPNIREFLDGKVSSLSCTLEIPELENDLVFVIPSTDTLRTGAGRIAGILGTVSKDEIADMLTMDIFGENYAYVVVSDLEGNVIVDGHAQKQFGENWIETFRAFSDEDLIQSLRKDMRQGVKNTRELMGVTRKFLLYYTPLVDGGSDIQGSITDWRLMIMTRPDVLEENISNLFQESRIILYLVLVVLLTVMVVSILALARRKRSALMLQCTDSLTGLLNDKRFQADANLLISGGTGQYALVSMDIVRFKMINNKLGRSGADQVLKTIGKTLRDFLRPDEAASRSFADHFTILLNLDGGDGDRLRAMEDRLRKAGYPKNLNVKFSFGLYRLKPTDHSIAGPIDAARFAGSLLKNSSGTLSNVVTYDEAAFEQQRVETIMEEMAENALKNGEFVVYYQLQRGIQGQSRWNGCEALVRWNNSKLGMIYPNDFIPLFERNGFIVRIDYAVFEIVCKNLRESLDRGERIVPVSVNLSKFNLENMEFLDAYEALLEKYRVPRDHIEFEITETMIARDGSLIKAMINRIHAMGCTCSLDDFGTDYSSFHMLQEFPFDTVKLDWSFFRGPNGFNAKAQLIVETLIDLFHKLGMKVVAEGIEVSEQVEFLKQRNCDTIQGYYFAHPVPLEEFRRQLNEE